MAFMLADAAAAGAEKVAGSGFITFGQAWHDGGVLMWVLAGFSVLSLAVMIYLAFAHRRGGFLPDAIARIRAAKDPAAEGARIAESVNSSVDWLADIAAIAPLVGLLGTVYGIFEAFNVPVASQMSQADQMARATALTHGVSKAVVTTIFGLAVSIPTLMAHALFRRRAARLIAALEEKADEVQA